MNPPFPQADRVVRYFGTTLRVLLGSLVHKINTLPLWFFLRPAQTILDVGCGSASPVQYFLSPSQVLDGVDIIPPEPPLPKRYRQVIKADVRTFEPSQAYDTITALDLIEHLDKTDGLKFLDRLERLASSRVIILTPNGFVPQPPEVGNPFQEHKSGWTTEEFRARGYRVYGMFGPQWLRTGTAVARFRPAFFWAGVALLLTPLYFWRPQSAFSLLAVYTTPSRS